MKFGKDSMQAASDVEQMEQKFNVVFDNLSGQADEWAGNLANAIGRSKNIPLKRTWQTTRTCSLVWYGT